MSTGQMRIDLLEKSALFSELIIESRNKKKAKGDRVAFVILDKYSVGASNPLIGTNYECLGRVSHATTSGLRVDWDNGSHNSYSHSDLVLIKTGVDPNRLFMFKERLIASIV